jgi:branched-chain amino acid transport system ATP-binding protein
MLEVSNIGASYSGITALRGVSVKVATGKIVGLIGPNGAGKSTLLNTISGIVSPTQGAIRFDGQDITRTPAYKTSRAGLLQVPEGRQIIPELTVIENLQLGAVALHGRKPTHSFEDVFQLFPILDERRQQIAGSLSGGQQQMLAIGRALMGGPRLLLLDEPSLGLSPLMTKLVFEALRKLNERGLTIFLVDQNARLALKFTDYAYVLELGRIVLEGPSRELADNPEIIAHYFGQMRKEKPGKKTA